MNKSEIILGIMNLYDENTRLKNENERLKDLLKSFADVDEGWNGRVLNECYIIRNMRHKGYFKNVDLSMTFREVLGNCEVVE